MKLWSLNSRANVNLGQVVGRGGEGTVHEIIDSPRFVAKIYEPPDPAKREKLEAMTHLNESQLRSVSAWPVDVLFDEHNRARGFVMPRIASRGDIHEVYSPKSRASEFPEADFRFLVHVCANVARAVATVHKHGHVIGDINQGSILVGNDGTVILIDCDSFQINAGGRIFTCDVGVPLFTAPELHGVQFRGLTRTSNHDAFGLAIILFHLLFLGRHPFAGRFLGPGDMPIERAIREFRFAYGAARRDLHMESPPGTVPLVSMGPEVSGLFEKAFGRPGVGQRPSAGQWVDALERLGELLKPCSKVGSHFLPTVAGHCPWCVVEGATGSRLFGQRIVVPSSIGTVSIQGLWAAVEAVPSPGPVPQVSAPSGQNSRPEIWIRLRQLAAILVGLGGICYSIAVPGTFGVTVGAVAMAYFLLPRASSEDRRKNKEAKGLWEKALADWKSKTGDVVFRRERESLESARRELANLSNERARRMSRLHSEREAVQRGAYLDRFRIDRGKIHLVGDARIAMLASYGIETAADVELSRIRSIPGFGKTITRNLLSWRSEHERNFRFNPSQGVEGNAIAELERELGIREKALIVQLQEGPTRLALVRTEVLAARERLKGRLSKALLEKELAEQRVNFF